MCSGGVQIRRSLFVRPQYKKACLVPYLEAFTRRLQREMILNAVLRKSSSTYLSSLWGLR